MMTFVVHQRGFGFCGSRGTQLEYFHGWFSSLDLDGFCRHDFSMGNNVARIDWVWTQAFMMLRSYLGG